jgi:hypothetical protein
VAGSTGVAPVLVNTEPTLHCCRCTRRESTDEDTNEEQGGRRERAVAERRRHPSSTRDAQVERAVCMREGECASRALSGRRSLSLSDGDAGGDTKTNAQQGGGRRGGDARLRVRALAHRRCEQTAHSAPTYLVCFLVSSRVDARRPPVCGGTCIKDELNCTCRLELCSVRGEDAFAFHGRTAHHRRA